MIKRIIYCILFLGLGSAAFSQIDSPIGIQPLKSNPKLAQTYMKQQKTLHPGGSQFYFIDDTIGLPFIDDFSKDLFKDFRLESYTGIYQDTLNYFRVDNYFQEFPDSVWYVLEQPDSFQVINPDSFIVIPSTAPQFKIYIYDQESNPYAIADSIMAWRYIPIIVDIIDGDTIYDDNTQPDGKIYNFQKIYYVVPPSANDISLWTDRDVYVNDGIAVKPPTIGVAVFDGIGMNGMPYTTMPTRGVADYLTSKPIDLSGYLPGDSLYLSFFVQPQGNGFFPEARDTFVLEFKAPGSANWQWMWSRRGSAVKPFDAILVPIKDPKWFVKGFQFRFKNHANLDANADHWLLDYVYLDEGRNINDSLMNDVAFATRAPSILRDYEQMPAHQFDQPEVNQKWAMQSSNLWSSCKWATIGHATFDEGGTMLTSYPEDDDPGSYDTSCVNTYFPNREYNTNFRHNLPSFSYVFDVQDPNCCPYQDSISFTVRHVIQNLTAGPGSGVLTYDENTGNDTVYRHQTFYNFYAYDDGEAEGSMYLGTTGSIAYEFSLNFADTLRAVQIYFDPQSPLVTNNNFELRVWTNLNDTGEDTAYAEASLNPIYNPDGPNSFTTYILNRPVALSAGTFYIGWKQTQQFHMNIGYDKNNNKKDKMYYKTTGPWSAFADLASTQYEFAMMIRPVLGKPVSADQFLDVPQETITTVNIFPNPSTGIYYYELNADVPTDLEIQVVDLSGKVVYSKRATYDKTIDLSHLNNGIYFTRFISKSTSLTSVHKLILSK